MTWGKCLYDCFISFLTPESELRALWIVMTAQPCPAEASALFPSHSNSFPTTRTYFISQLNRLIIQTQNNSLQECLYLSFYVEERLAMKIHWLLKIIQKHSIILVFLSFLVMICYSYISYKLVYNPGTKMYLVTTNLLNTW